MFSGTHLKYSYMRIKSMGRIHPRVHAWVYINCGHTVGSANWVLTYRWTQFQGINSSPHNSAGLLNIPCNVVWKWPGTQHHKPQDTHPCGNVQPPMQRRDGWMPGINHRSCRTMQVQQWEQAKQRYTSTHVWM